MWVSCSDNLVYSNNVNRTEEFGNNYQHEVANISKSIPNDLPTPIQELLAKCFSLHPDDRPNFDTIYMTVDNVLKQCEK